MVSAPGYPNDSSQTCMTINALKSESQRRILVTGSRGKSSIVRLLHTAMNAAGFKTYARITGVVPRELGADGIRTISRSAGAQVEEMRWWLGQLSLSVQGVILENSAITAEFQGLAGRWLQPGVTVLTNTLPLSVTFGGALPGQGSCSEAGGIVTCELAALAPDAEVVVAITDGQLHLGPWEHIFYYEFDGRRRKRVLVKIIGE